MNTSTKMPATMRERWALLLELATREVFQLMLATELTGPEAEVSIVQEVTSMVRMTGLLSGVMSIRCEGKAAALMAAKMLGVEPEKVGAEKVGAEIADALGEICNMVAGNFKNKIPGLGDGCTLSPPTIITGREYQAHSTADKSALEVKLLFESMPMMVSLEINS